MITFLNSEEVIAKTWEIILFLTLKPESTQELVVSLILGCLVLAVVLAKAHSLGSSSSGSIVMGIFVTIFCLFGLIEVAVLSELLLLPLMEKVFQPYAYYGSIVVGFFLLIVPFTRICFRAEYFSSVGAWTVAALVAGMTLFGVDYYFVDREENSPTVESVQEYTKTVSEKVKAEGDKIKIESERILKKEEPTSPTPNGSSPNP